MRRQPSTRRERQSTYVPNAMGPPTEDSIIPVGGHNEEDDPRMRKSEVSYEKGTVGAFIASFCCR